MTFIDMGTVSIIKEFVNKLAELRLSYQVYTDKSYLLRLDGNVGRTIKVKLICSDQADESEYGSRNGIIIQSMGVFKFKLPSTETDTDFFILGFASSTNQGTDFVIISTKELKRSLIKKNQISKPYNKISIVFWLMDDKFLYDCTRVGVQWEWYYLSRGLNGRMVDGSVWDYSEYLNNWDRLTLK